MFFQPHAPGSSTRLPAPAPRPGGGTPNINPRYALDEAAWLWHPDCRVDEGAFLLFRLDFSTGDDDGEGPIALQISADLRFELALDGVLVARGPDSGDVSHWSFSQLGLRPGGPGPHRLEALVWWLPAADAPAGRMSWRGGFACAEAHEENAPTTPTTRFHTGFAPWRVAALAGWSLTGRLPWTYHVIGSGLRVDRREFDPARAVWTEPARVREPLNGNESGLLAPGWTLEPAALPEQRHDLWRGAARVRHAVPAWEADAARVLAAHTDPARAERWRQLWHGEAPLTLPPGEAATVLVDLDDYVNGYPVIEFAGGDGAELHWEWAESLYENPYREKGHRDEVEGKIFGGFGDRFTFGGPPEDADHRHGWVRSHWWRAGRFLRLRVRVADAPLTLHTLAVERTGLPFAPTMAFTCDDATLAPVLELCLRGLRCTLNDTYVDSPYYEQMMYAADTRLEMLMTYVASGDDTLPRRGMDLIGSSRGATSSGLTAMRYPSSERQESATFAMFWVWMLHDFAWWRDDRRFLARHLPGVRGVLDALARSENDDGLLARPPGWLFVDWVPAWQHGWAPGSRDPAGDGVSGLVNLQYLLTLQKAADLEDGLGEPALAARLRERAAGVGAAVRARFWNEARGLFADDSAHAHWSQHAQIWALLAGLRAPDPDAAWADPARVPADLAAASVYFRHYQFDAYGLMGRTDHLLRTLDDWRALVALGLKAPVESPEPARSDCHAWGSHPLYHLPVTVAGIRPDAWGFARVRIAPQPGPLTALDCALPHPRGVVRLRAEFPGGGRVRGQVELPPGVPGVFAWNGRETALVPGTQTVEG